MSLLTSPSSNRNPNQVGKVAELDFVTAPHNIPGEDEQYGWWFSKVQPLYFYIQYEWQFGMVASYLVLYLLRTYN